MRSVVPLFLNKRRCDDPRARCYPLLYGVPRVTIVNVVIVVILMAVFTLMILIIIIMVLWLWIMVLLVSPLLTPLFCVVIFIHSFIYSFIHSGYFYSASSSLLLLKSTPDTTRILCQSFTPKRHRQVQVKDLSKVHTWRLERNSNPRPFGWKATNLQMSHHAQYVAMTIFVRCLLL